MAERMTFPMYAIHRQQTQALWQAVQSLLDEAVRKGLAEPVKP